VQRRYATLDRLPPMITGAARDDAVITTAAARALTFGWRFFHPYIRAALHLDSVDFAALQRGMRAPAATRGRSGRRANPERRPEGAAEARASQDFEARARLTQRLCAAREEQSRWAADDCFAREEPRVLRAPSARLLDSRVAKSSSLQPSASDRPLSGQGCSFRERRESIQRARRARSAVAPAEGGASDRHIGCKETRLEGASRVEWVRTGCPYCGVGCGLRAAVESGRIAKVKGDPEHPSSRGEVCMKAVCLPPTVENEGRATRALVRAHRALPFRASSIDAAISHVAAELRRIVGTHGPGAVAFYGSGQLGSEDYYALAKLAKGFIGTDHVDTNSRLCMASAVAGYKSAFGADAPPGCYDDIDSAEVIFVLGANVADCHPILFRRIERRVAADDSVRVIVADPRRTETCDLAHAHLPIRPGSDVALLNAMLRLAIEEGHVDKEFIAVRTEGFESARLAVEAWTPEVAAELCGVPPRAIAEAARSFARSRRALLLWSMGANQSAQGTAKNQAILNLCLATGNVGKPGCGPFSLTGQPNAMGGREVGGLAGLLPGHRQIASAADRAFVAERWGVPVERIPARPGKTATEIFSALEDGSLRALVVLATNPAASLPDIESARRALRRAELLVVHEAFVPTDTTELAHVVLPAAGWGEKDCAMTNSERVVTLSRKLVDAPGDALPDWQLLARLATELGFGEHFAWTSAAEVFDEFRRLTAGTSCDLSGITHARLERGPLQWPCRDATSEGEPRRYAERFATASGRARFHAVQPLPPAEPVSRDFPLVLTSGRLKSHWHTRSRTRWSKNLESRAPEPILVMHPVDAKRAGIVDGGFAAVESRRGEVLAQVRVTPEIAPGTLFLPFHWTRQDGLFKPANNLTHAAIDPISKQPELKHCAVRVRALPTPEELT
jgi:anaerobic selenocysteine-containing dehydrogenase